MSSKKTRLIGLKELYKLMDGIPAQAKAKTLKRIAKGVLRKKMKNTLESKFIKLTKIADERRSRTGTGVLFGFISKYNFLNWIEYGTQLRTRKSGGKTGKMPPKPFWRKHLDRNIPSTIREYFNDYSQMMKKFINRNRRK